VSSKERMGISRTVIKNYIESNYGMEITPSVVSNISRALKSGEDKNIFVFPKGALVSCPFSESIHAYQTCSFCHRPVWQG
jgi:hypothetical protein